MFSPLKVAVAVFGACLLVIPSIAQADVIQTDAAGFKWITGSASDTAQTSKAVETEAAEGPAYTQAVATAGPETWRAHISALAAKYDLSPALLEAVVWQESRWRTAAVSRAGAQGLAQLMPGTARQMGVDIADPRANLEGGARYLRIQLDTFGGDVEKALAAYNAGPGRVETARGVPRIPETQAYVAAIMARLADQLRR
jgi:soluble lytic murein transglycosylase-like protein